jgi:hypothetical protein
MISKDVSDSGYLVTLHKISGFKGNA